MKLDFNWEDDGNYHQYCAHCHAETVERIYQDEKTYYKCSTCSKVRERSIVIDPKIKWWTEDDGEYVHESSGVFVRNPEGKFLFFERAIFPFSYTVPSGHVDMGEQPLQSAERECEEEVGLKAKNLIHIASEKIDGDSCRRGADVHRWHAYLLVLDDTPEIEVKEEGGQPIWLSIKEAESKELTYPVKYIINKFNEKLRRAI